MRVKFWGVRGSIPVPGPDTVRVGGNTPCVEVQTTDREVIILDAGTGIRLLGLDLVQRPVDRLIGVLLFSHTHWDHIQGLPFFSPAKLRNSRLVVLGERRVDRRLDQVLAGQMSDAYLPFTLADLHADLLIKEVHDGEKIVVGNDTTVLPRRLHHPGGVFGYRIGCHGKTVVYASDVNHPPDGPDLRLVELAQDADLLIHDAQFTPEEKQERLGWGHSTWQEAVQVAQQANVRRLILFHHDPQHTDDELEEIEGQAQRLFPLAFLAREGMEIVL
ncbi:MAG: MBL fold metallo-hydrolase [Anaerolineae bacterium]|jgi:ribonuclease Z